MIKAVRVDHEVKKLVTLAQKRKCSLNHLLIQIRINWSKTVKGKEDSKNDRKHDEWMKGIALRAKD